MDIVAPFVIFTVVSIDTVVVSGKPDVVPFIFKYVVDEYPFERFDDGETVAAQVIS